ncbi:MAG TPA: M15 family metallopeptidase [Nocardioides sp.]|nr:M15 family metallopeptidase [Nocardioides sp.]
MTRLRFLVLAVLGFAAVVWGPALATSSAGSSALALLPGALGPSGSADGRLPEGTSVFDDDQPGVVRLEHELLAALRAAARDAEADGVTFVVNSGWRSASYQQDLLDDAVAEYGSEEAAARWVATPRTSPHVSGHAVDLGPQEATDWLAEHGASYGLCRTYANEPWHFELRPEAVGGSCPQPYDDPTEDPRLQQ